MKYRVKVTIRCQSCGERYILKGRRAEGKVDTGFKKCLCNNDSNFEVQYENEL
ncbi:hypothetical protein VQL36_07800 [Chengkuizengella sp. SCS-71B]|uniref:hypothetical protein n=1 Tax=Chengkuizengella sp. SCS-71B TaxID=3115290 RepID=UPI0032C22BA7